VHETAADLEALQGLLDESNAASGEHLRRIITPERRLDAAALAARLAGVRLLALATATADGRPIVGPVDGVFYRGAFWFGSAPDSVRFRHIRVRPDVSATHIEGEPFAVTVHGRAHIFDLRDPDAAGFRDALIEVYTPRYGEAWIEFAEKHPFARIDARRMYTFVYEEPIGE
jgi:nitroimidazol reductase NimA-like FMN-containing flavoprotein (pyridoxamine 5'-phosphate oxidase superfamily)